MSDSLDYGRGEPVGRTTIAVPVMLRDRVARLSARLGRQSGRSVSYDEVVERAVDLLEKKLKGESGE
jgi:hypothetical protein